MASFEDLPYYPYSLIGAAALILVLLLLVLLMLTRKRASSSSSSKKRNSGPVRGRTATGPVRGLPVDGLSPQGEIDMELIQRIQKSSMEKNTDKTDKPVLPVAPVPPKPPVDPAVIEAAVKSCQEKFQETYIEMYLGLGLMSDFEQLRAEVGRRIADGKETYHAIAELKMTPEGVILMQMSSVAGNILQSGEHHIGKGLLGIYGQELFNIYRYALTAMQEKGFSSRAETQSKLDFMDQKIRELG
jgi:hypothetical protein